MHYTHTYTYIYIVYCIMYRSCLLYTVCLLNTISNTCSIINRVVILYMYTASLLSSFICIHIYYISLLSLPLCTKQEEIHSIERKREQERERQRGQREDREPDTLCGIRKHPQYWQRRCSYPCSVAAKRREAK